MVLNLETGAMISDWPIVNILCCQPVAAILWTFMKKPLTVWMPLLSWWEEALHGIMCSPMFTLASVMCFWFSTPPHPFTVFFFSVNILLCICKCIFCGVEQYLNVKLSITVWLAHYLSILYVFHTPTLCLCTYVFYKVVSKHITRTCGRE